MTIPESSSPQSSAPPAVQVYIAEDDPHLNDLAVMLMQCEGLTCRSFFNGEAALAAFKQADPKPLLILSDFSMGHLMDGVALLAACKQIEPKTRAFLVSGTVDETMIRVDGNPVDYFMPKPYNTHELLRITRVLINQRLSESVKK